MNGLYILGLVFLVGTMACAGVCAYQKNYGMAVVSALVAIWLMMLTSD